MIIAPHDGPRWTTYAQVMGEGRDHLILTIDTKDPIEIGDFVGQFTSLANQYEKFVRETYPDITEAAEVFVSEVKEGSIIAILIPLVGSGIFAAGKVIEHMEKILVVEDFVRRYAGRVSPYFSKGGRDKHASKGDLKDFHNAVAAIASDPNASAKLEAAHFVDGERQIKASFVFNTQQARIAEQEIESHKLELDTTTSADHERVVMTFVRSDIRATETGKRSGELVMIEPISKRPLALIYASQLAEQRIKYEIRDDESVYKKGFVVDVNVETKNGKPIAYRVTNVHQVFDIPSDDDPPALPPP